MSDIRAVAYGRRIRAIFGRAAELITVEQAGVGRDYRALLAPMTNAEAAVYFDANESVGLTKPSLSAWFEGEDVPGAAGAPLVGDIFTRDRRLWTVRKTQIFRKGDRALLVLALCD